MYKLFHKLFGWEYYSIFKNQRYRPVRVHTSPNGIEYVKTKHGIKKVDEIKDGFRLT